jgi:hypothetical protein
LLSLPERRCHGPSARHSAGKCVKRLGVRRLDAALKQGKAQAEGGAKSPHSKAPAAHALYRLFPWQSKGEAAGDEESRISCNFRARLLAKFTLSSFAALRTVRSGRANGLGMTRSPDVFQKIVRTKLPRSEAARFSVVCEPQQDFKFLRRLLDL